MQLTHILTRATNAVDANGNPKMAPQCRHAIVDANVVGAATADDDASDLRGVACRDALRALRAGSLHIVLTAFLRYEWSCHASGYAREWHRYMAERSRTCEENWEFYDTHLRDRVKRVVCSDEDMHLIEAAIATNGVIISSDNRARKRFKRAAAIVTELASIAWVDPTRPTDSPIEWIEDGAPEERGRLLGAANPLPPTT